MKIRPRNLNRYGAATALCIFLAVCCASFFGWFRASDDFLFDLGLSAKPAPRQSHQVVLIYAPKTFFKDPNCTQLSRLVHQLLVYRARRVGILFDPDPQQFEILGSLPAADKIVIGNRLNSPAAGREKANDNNLLVIPGIACGFRDLNMDQSIYRQHPMTVEQNGASFPSLEKVIVGQLLNSSDVPHGMLGINYVGGPEDLPHIAAQQVLDQEVVSELVQDRIVLIGRVPDENTGVITPTTHGAQRMSHLEVHGNILTTILHQNSIQSAGVYLSIVLLMATTLFSCQLLRQVPSALILRSFVYCQLAVVLISWLALYLCSAKLPLSGMLVATSLAMLTSFHTRFETLKELFESWNLMRQSETQADWKAEEKDTWTLISDSVYQIFYPNRMVLMELDSGATHLTVTKTIQCTPEDILERRRDINREPFRAAVELGSALRIQNRQFFVINQETECFEYVAPLILVSEPVGLMVLEMTAESVKNWDDFENFLSQFTGDMAVLVNRYRLIQQHESRQNSILATLKDVPEQNRKQTLFQTEVEHHNLENLLDDAFETIQTAAAICDVFGRTIRTNAKMVEMLQRNGVVVDNADCVSMLESLTGWRKNECRKIFRQCLVEGRNQQTFLPDDGRQNAPRVLYLEPLNKGDDEPEISSRCVCIQVIEGNIFQESTRWQEDFAKTNLQHVVHRLEDLKVLANRLQPRLQDRQIAGEIAKTVNECRAMLNLRFSEEPENFVLFDTRSAWRSCISKIHVQLESDGIQVVQRFENGRLEAVANPFLLERVFSAALECIRHDVGEAGEILVTGHCIGTHVVYSFSEVASGGPIKEFRKSLAIGSGGTGETGTGSGSDDCDPVSVLTPAQSDQFREIESWLKEWNATLSIRCRENYRICIELILCAQPDPPICDGSWSSVDSLQDSERA